MVTFNHAMPARCTFNDESYTLRWSSITTSESLRSAADANHKGRCRPGFVGEIHGRLGATREYNSAGSTRPRCPNSGAWSDGKRSATSMRCLCAAWMLRALRRPVMGGNSLRAVNTSSFSTFGADMLSLSSLFATHLVAPTITMVCTLFGCYDVYILF